MSGQTGSGGKRFCYVVNNYGEWIVLAGFPGYNSISISISKVIILCP